MHEEHKIVPHYAIPTTSGGIPLQSCFHVETVISHETFICLSFIIGQDDIPQYMSCAVCVSSYVPATSLGHPGC